MPTATTYTPSAGLSNITNIVHTIGDVVNMLIPIVIGIAILVFFWGLVKYIRSSGKGHTEGKNIMIAGLVALFIMVSVWGIIRFAQTTLSIQGNDSNNRGIAPGVPAQVR